ncbi:MAG: hypothetical protein LC798_02990 [Chloroflexi bacterium]|nr:hypothetical protein [Chloroflexota bacterium]
MLWVFGALTLVAVLAILVALLLKVRKIDDQLTTNTGASLRDAVNRIDAAAERIEGGAMSDRRLARGVAADLAVAQSAVEGVASDLSESHDRADAADGPHGAAADAASQRGREE